MTLLWWIYNSSETNKLGYLGLDYKMQTCFLTEASVMMINTHSPVFHAQSDPGLSLTWTPSVSRSRSLSLLQSARKKQQQQWTAVALIRMDSSAATPCCPHWSHGREEGWSWARWDTCVHVLILLRSILIWLHIDNSPPNSRGSKVLCVLRLRIE